MTEPPRGGCAHTALDIRAQHIPTAECHPRTARAEAGCLLCRAASVVAHSRKDLERRMRTAGDIGDIPLAEAGRAPPIAAVDTADAARESCNP